MESKVIELFILINIIKYAPVRAHNLFEIHESIQLDAFKKTKFELMIVTIH